MRNVQMERQGNELVIRVKLDGEREASRTGKTEIVATTHGNQAVPGCRGVFIGVNCFAYPDARIDGEGKK